MYLSFQKVKLCSEFFLCQDLLGVLIRIPVLQQFDRDSKKSNWIDAHEHLNNLWKVKEWIAQRFRVIDRIIDVESDVTLQDPGDKRGDKQPDEETNIPAGQKEGRQQVIKRKIGESNLYRKIDGLF